MPGTIRCPIASRWLNFGADHEILFSDKKKLLAYEINWVNH